MLKTEVNGISASEPLQVNSICLDSPSISSEISTKVYAIAENPTSNLQKPIRHALDVIEKALDEYGEDAVALSFNGGKDCTVILEMLTAALNHRKRTRNGWQSTSSTNTSLLNYPPIPTLYASVLHPFPEEDDFVTETVARYNLDIVKINAPMRQALEEFLKRRPRIKAILVGTRRMDPHGTNLRSFDMTDKNWPQVMRVHPILDWSYSQVWTFLVNLKVSYCKLYDLGYTSLGGTNNTIPNPKLRNRSGYDPAWMLKDGACERAGRS